MDRDVAAMDKKDQQVFPSYSGWAVARSGAARASRVFGTRAEALKYARAIARRDQAALYVHKEDGTVLSKYSYAKSPVAPSGKK
jgi:hypothetical protein